MTTPLLIYGAYGYTGTLIAELAVQEGLRPVLAGRNRARTEALAARLGCEARVFGLEDAGALAEGLEGVQAVLHCAGPFAHTASAMAEACLATGAHYLDITGEIGVFEMLAAMDARASAAGVMLLPGVGFDVVPSDCLAAHLKRRLPDAIHLSLAFHSHGRVSHGTATTMVENLPDGGKVRRDGRIVTVPGAWRVRDIDFGPETRTCMTIPWGDVSSAFYSTGIPNIEVYMAAPAGLRLSAKLSRVLGPVLGSGSVQRFLKARIPEGGPDAETRRRGYCLLWGEARNEAGRRAEARLRTPEGYTLTAATALLIARRVLAGDFGSGFKTPSLAYGPDLILEVPGVERNDG